MAHYKRRVFNLLLLLCLSSLSNAENNICELPNEHMFCSCDSVEPHEETEKVSCFVFGNVTSDDPIWDYFRWKPNIMDLTFNSRIDSELRFIPTEVLQSLEKLKVVTFRQSKLGTLERYTFSKLVSVTSIYLGSNEITELQERCFYRMHNLNQIELGENYIRRIPPNAFVDLPALQKLYLERNNITKLEPHSFQNLRNLQELDLHMNSIRKLERGSFLGLERLVRLDLFKNRLEILKAGVFSSLNRLVELDISDNLVWKIEVDAFKGLDNLITLHLKSNRITQLPSGLFIGIPQLMHADLSDNQLESVRSTTIEEMKCRFKEQFVINLEDNNLICDCDLWWWTADYLNKSLSTEWKKQLRNIKCHFPHRGKISYRINNLPASKIGCSEIKTTSVTTEAVFESPAVLLVNEGTSSESSSPQTDSSETHVLRDESQKNPKDSMAYDASVDNPTKQDSLVTKGTVEIQQSGHKGKTNAAPYSCSNSFLMTLALVLASSLCFVQ